MAMWLGPEPLVLASQSEIRRKILVAAEIPVEIKPAAIDERAVEQAASRPAAGDVALLLAAAKARAIAATMPGRLVLGADQTLAFGDRVFSKATDRAAARAQLLLLRGQTHVLHSAIVLVREGAVLFEHVSTARLTMRRFSDAFVDRYLDTVGAAALHSVGGYQLEGVGIHLFDRIEGDHFTILGLPLLPLLGFLRAQGWVDA
jgi:septum formation protein